MDNIETQATLGTRHRYEDQQNKNTTQKTKKITNTDPTKNRRWTQKLEKGKQFLFLIRQSPCYSQSNHFVLSHSTFLLYRGYCYCIQNCVIVQKTLCHCTEHFDIIQKLCHYMNHFVTVQSTSSLYNRVIILNWQITISVIISIKNKIPPQL